MIGLSFQFKDLHGQCEVVATALPNDITCGTCVTLTAFGEGQGNSVFTENFNSGAPTAWQSTAQATYSNPCDPAGVDGTPHLWMGDATGVPRQMTTNSFDFSTAAAGATICFDMLFAEQGDASPCEGPDEPDEGVYLQYSIDNGVTWITINYFDPNGGNDASLVNWNNWCFPIPAAALTANTQIRWFQDNDSGADYDHWGLDNVNIYFNDPTFNITWQHDSYSYGIGNGGGDNPTPVCPQTTTTYSVTMTNGTSTCTGSVSITVTDPVFRVSATPDTILCPGDCVDLIGEAVVVVSPAKTPTYENSELAALAGLPSAQDLVNILIPCVDFAGCTCPDGSTVPFLGACPTVFTGTLSMNINITDLNTTSLQSGELTSVCIGDALMLVGDLTPFAVSLTCPSGSTITLANAGDLTGTSLTNTCFDLTSVTPVIAGSSPYSGSFQPINPLTNLNGCDANGVWTLSFTGTFDLSSGTLPLGVLNGWSISFDDPEISYTGDILWSPSTNLSATNILNPTACPPVTQSYTIVVVDTAGCSSDSASVLITVDQAVCCPFDMNYTSVTPGCGLANGSIDVTVSNGSGNYSYSWTNGLPAIEDASNLASGMYTITVTDNVSGCSKDTTIVLTALNAPVIDSIVAVPSSCGLNNGQATVFASGGVGLYSYSLDGGTSTQNSALIDMLIGGNYVMTVTDAGGCTNTQSFQIDTSFAVQLPPYTMVNSMCGFNNGECIIVYPTTGIPPYLFSIDGGLTFSADTFYNNLDTGMYLIMVMDSQGCTDMESANISLLGLGVVLDSVQSNPPSCGASDGNIEMFASGADVPFQYSIDNGASFQASPQFMSLASSTYQLLIEDDFGCQDSTSLSLTPLNSPVLDSILTTDPSCLGADGSIEVFASGGLAPLSYSIDNGLTFQASNVFNSLIASSYNVVVEDASGCPVSQITQLTAPSQMAFVVIVIIPSTCGNDNGEIDILLTGGTAPFNYSIDNGLSFQSNNEFTNLPPENYTVLVQEQGNPLCQIDSVVSVGASSSPTLDSLLITNETCAGLNDGSISLSISGGQASYSVSYNGNVGSLNETALSPGSYTIEVVDANGCIVNGFASVLAGGQLGIQISNDTSVYTGESVNLISQGSNSNNGVYLWSPSDGLSCVNCQNPTALANSDITYQVSFTDTLTNCTVSEEVIITVLSKEAFCLFPDAFSPNGDNVNDAYGPICEELVFLELKIYNRWGELIFKEEDSSSNIRWDGTFKGEPALLDTYIFVATMEYTDGVVESKTGNFTLIR
ncbi:MAG: gliding motility-associated-like protein [Chitinophagales bacterium]|jgi:gliding motility-associated-like protein